MHHLRKRQRELQSMKEDHDLHRKESKISHREIKANKKSTSLGRAQMSNELFLSERIRNL